MHCCNNNNYNNNNYYYYNYYYYYYYKNAMNWTWTFQMWTHLSNDPLAMCRPSGLKATLYTGSRWRVNLWTHWPRSTSHRRTVESNDALHRAHFRTHPQSEMIIGQSRSNTTFQNTPTTSHVQQMDCWVKWCTAQITSNQHHISEHTHYFKLAF